MSSRYALYQIDALRDRFALTNGVPKGIKPHYNISPTQLIPVIISRDGEITMERMRWGYVPSGAKNMNSVFRYKTHSTKSETIFDKPMWRQEIRTSRCLIPANGFYEWKKNQSGKNPFYIHPTDQATFAFAGVHTTWTDPAGIKVGICALITVASDDESDMTPSRLPVIVHPDDEADWLNPAIDDFSTLINIMRPYDSDKLSVHKVSGDVDSTKTNAPHLIEKV